MSCSHNNTLTFGGKTRDLNYWTLPSGRSGDGYVPGFFSEDGRGGGDYIDLNICIDCHVVLNLNEKAILEADLESKKKVVLDAFFDDFKTIDEVVEETAIDYDEVQSFVDQFTKDGHLRLVTTDDCQVFDEGAMTGEYMYEEVYGY